jgi:ketosteroid isomerase-like protein
MNEDERYLRQIDGEWNEAYPNRNIETLNRIIADDWKGIDGAGQIISKQQLLERVAANPDPFDSHKFDEFSLRIFGDIAIITGRLSGKGRSKDGDFSVEQRYTRVYVKRDNRWYAVATQVTVVPNS